MVGAWLLCAGYSSTIQPSLFKKWFSPWPRTVLSGFNTMGAQKFSCLATITWGPRNSPVWPQSHGGPGILLSGLNLHGRPGILPSGLDHYGRPEILLSGFINMGAQEFSCLASITMGDQKFSRLASITWGPSGRLTCCSRSTSRRSHTLA